MLHLAGRQLLRTLGTARAVQAAALSVTEDAIWAVGSALLDHRAVSQQLVAEALGVTRQAVSKRLRQQSSAAMDDQLRRLLATEAQPSS